MGKIVKLPDPRNEHIKVWVNGEIVPRNEAKVSVFDSVVQGGDAVWEGLRVYNGRIFQLDAHLARLQDSARSMSFTDVPSSQEIRLAVFKTLEANQMKDEVHIRLTLTRGEKLTSGMSPEWNQSGCSLIILPEWKKPVYDPKGIRLITSSVRRNPPQCLDSKIHHNNLINNILAKIESNLAGVEDALMLDIHGFVSETNATNVFLIKNGVLITPLAESCLPGITRGVVMEIANKNNIPLEERRVTISEMYNADEVFVTGTMGELTPVLEIDGRPIGNKSIGEFTTRLLDLYLLRTKEEGEPLPF